MTTILYLAHSLPRYRNQAVFSILSLRNFIPIEDDRFNIVVYTDDSAPFNNLGVEVIELSKAKLTDWMGEKQFVHRAKIKLMIDAKDRFDGDLIFMDSDHFVHQDPTSYFLSLTAKHSLMYESEYSFADPADNVGHKYRKFFKRNASFKLGQKEIIITDNTVCWNSSVIGIHNENLHLLSDVLELCDQFHHQFPKHLSEQLAFGVILQQHTDISAFNKVSYHWFGHGQAINSIIEKVFEKCGSCSIAERISIVTAVEEEVLNAPLNSKKRKGIRSLWHRLWN